VFSHSTLPKGGGRKHRKGNSYPLKGESGDPSTEEKRPYPSSPKKKRTTKKRSVKKELLAVERRKKKKDDLYNLSSGKKGERESSYTKGKGESPTAISTGGKGKNPTPKSRKEGARPPVSRQHTIRDRGEKRRGKKKKTCHHTVVSGQGGEKRSADGRTFS